MNTQSASTTATKRRWLPRFGLRTLLVAMTVLGIGLGYVGMLLQRVRHQRHIVSLIEAAGGEVRYNYQFGMGSDLDYVLHRDQAPTWITELDRDIKVKSRYRTDADGRTIERQIETPPGPKIVRMVLGDDIFASVESVSFFTSEFKPAKEIDQQLLLELPELKVVCLTYGQVSDGWLRRVAQVPRLRFLNLLGYEEGTATSAGLGHLESAKNLECLSVSGEWLQDESATGIARLRQLKSLSFSSVPNLTSNIFSNLNELTELRELNFFRAKKINDEGADSLRRLTNLRVLYLVETTCSHLTLAHLSGLTQLESLDLSGTNVGDAGMEHVAALPKLKYLRLASTGVGDAGVQSLSRSPSLQNLQLGFTKVTDGSLPTLGRMTQLEELSLWETSVTDCGVQQLGTLKNLRDLSLGETGVTDQGGHALRSILPRKCKIYWSSF